MERPLAEPTHGFRAAFGFGSSAQLGFIMTTASFRSEQERRDDVHSFGCKLARSV
jgi:hypothetical protein